MQYTFYARPVPGDELTAADDVAGIDSCRVPPVPQAAMSPAVPQAPSSAELPYGIESWARHRTEVAQMSRQRRGLSASWRAARIIACLRSQIVGALSVASRGAKRARM